MGKNAKKPLQENWITGNSSAGTDSSKHKEVYATKSVRIVQ